MDPSDLFLIVVRASVLYFFILLVVRLMGKREIGTISAFDLIVSLMIGEVVDEVIYGDVSLVKGFLAIGTVAVWHLVNSWASYRSKTIQKLTESSPDPVVKHGEIQRKAMARERMSDDDLWSQLRMQGVDDIKEVKQATIEPSGEISVLQEDWAKPVQKGDLEREEGKKE